MSHKNIRKFKILPNRSDERTDGGNEPQLKRSGIEETDQLTIVPISMVDLASSDSGISDISSNVGKLQFSFISICQFKI